MEPLPVGVGCHFRGGTPGGRSPTRVTPRKWRRNSCCRCLRQVVEVGVIRRSGVKARMRPLAVVELQIPTDRGARLADAVIGPEVDLLVFDRAPEPLDEDVVAPRSLAVHADGDGLRQQQAGELGAGELAALVRVEDLRPAVLGECVGDRLEAELHLHRDREPPGQNPAAEPVDHGGEIDEAARHGDVGDVHRPHPVRPLDLHVAQQIRVDLVPRRRLRGVRPAIERLDRHALHHRSNPAATDRDALAAQQVAQHPAARERVVEMQLVDPPHDRKIRRRYRTGPVVEAAAAQLQKLCLPRQRERMLAVDHRLALSMPALPSAPAKKSFSSASSPIFACSAFKSTAGAASGCAPPAPNTPAAPSRSCAFQLVIWFGCTSKSCASSASVFSPLMAASATFALKAGV